MSAERSSLGNYRQDDRGRDGHRDGERREDNSDHQYASVGTAVMPVNVLNLTNSVYYPARFRAAIFATAVSAGGSSNSLRFSDLPGITSSGSSP